MFIRLDKLHGSDRRDYQDLLVWINNAFTAAPYGSRTRCAADLGVSQMDITRVCRAYAANVELAHQIIEWLSADQSIPPPGGIGPLDRQRRYHRDIIDRLQAENDRYHAAILANNETLARTQHVLAILDTPAPTDDNDDYEPS